MGRFVVFSSVIGVLGMLLLVYAALAFAVGGPLASVSPSASGSPSTLPSASASGEPIGEIAISAFDLGFEPTTIDVDEPGLYEVMFTNTGELPHDVTFADGTVIAADAGAHASGLVTIPDGGTTFLCSIPGHADGGMRGTVTVGGAAPSATPDPDSHGGSSGGHDVAADPNAPPYEPRDAAAPVRPTGTVHDVELVIEETDLVIADGYVQRAWTFGGTVPGPVIRATVGDTVRIHLVNPASSELPHSVDFHSSMVAWNDEMSSIDPGEEKIYEFTAEFAGVWMYHCGTSPALHHIANGMYGMMIVEPPGGLPAVDAEFAIVQSEWYLGAQGEPASLAKASAAAPEADFVLFNGVANQYLDNPILIETGERVRVFVLNAGPSLDSSFHVVGTIFDTVIKEGVHLTPGNEGSWGSQAVDLAPAQGAIVEFVMAEDGLYPIVTHAFNFVGRGALGLFQAGDGDPLN